MVQPQLPNEKYAMHLWLWDYLNVFFMVYIYDSILQVKNKLLSDNDVSRTIKIMSPSERRFIFSQDAKAGGYSTAASIKLFSDPKITIDEDSLADMMNHEILHQVLKKVINQSTCKGLDNITKAYPMFNCDENKWYFEIKFINKRTGKTFD